MYGWLLGLEGRTLGAEDRGRWGALNLSQTDNAHRQQDPRCPRKASLQLLRSLWDEGGDRRKVTRREETARRGLDGRTVTSMCSLEGGAFPSCTRTADRPQLEANTHLFLKRVQARGVTGHCGLPR